MFGWEFARDFPRRVCWDSPDTNWIWCSAPLHFVQGLGWRHGRCLSTAPAFVPWDARCGGDGVFELWGARQKNMEQILLLVSTPKFGDIFSNLCTFGSCLMVEGRKRLVILRCLCFCFYRWEGSVCLHLWIIHTGHKVQSYPDILLVVQHLSEDPISTFYPLIQSHRLKASVYLTVTKTLIICRI